MFPVIIWEVGAKEVYIVETAERLPRATSFIIIATNLSVENSNKVAHACNNLLKAMSNDVFKKK